MNIIKGSPTDQTVLLRFDGGSNPNPGPTAGAYWFEIGFVKYQGGVYFEHGTNNIGEYEGLLSGLERLVELGCKNISIEGDSLLVISQISKLWKASHPEMEKRRNAAWKLFEQFDSITCRHIPRKENSIADKLSDETLVKKSSWRI